MDKVIFLNYNEAGGEETRRRIRARAAEYSHRIGPRKPKVRRKGSKSSNKRPNSDDEQQPEKPGMSRRGSALSVVSVATSSMSDTRDDLELVADNYIVSPTTTPPLSRLGSYADNPFDSYPVPSQSWFPEVLDYCKHAPYPRSQPHGDPSFPPYIVTAQGHREEDGDLTNDSKVWQFMWRGWSVLPITTPRQRDEALLWVKRLTMQDPTYFYMNLLSATGDLVSRGHRDARNIVWLTGEVVSSINKALSDPARALAAGTILTVGRLALREIMVGDVDAGITFHRPAFARMIVMAGGLGALDLPELVKMHLAWGDRLMTRKTGIPMSALEPNLADEPVFSGDGATAKADMQVLNTYLPFRSSMPPWTASIAGQPGVADHNEKE